MFKSDLQFVGKSISFLEKDKDARAILPISDITTMTPWIGSYGAINGATLKTKTGLSVTLSLSGSEYRKLFALVEGGAK